MAFTVLYEVIIGTPAGCLTVSRMEVILCGCLGLFTFHSLRCYNGQILAQFCGCFPFFC
uniref:Uncharacterized protein n=1 Tax=Arundo donax TaxID=35708 RepID=A0A0A9AFM7_ARUDO